jgi:hypothetical protein
VRETPAIRHRRGVDGPWSAQHEPLGDEAFWCLALLEPPVHRSASSLPGDLAILTAVGLAREPTATWPDHPEVVPADGPGWGNDDQRRMPRRL